MLKPYAITVRDKAEDGKIKVYKYNGDQLDSKHEILSDDEKIYAKAKAQDGEYYYYEDFDGDNTDANKYFTVAGAVDNNKDGASLIGPNASTTPKMNGTFDTKQWLGFCIQNSGRWAWLKFDKMAEISADQKYTIELDIAAGVGNTDPSGQISIASIAASDYKDLGSGHEADTYDLGSDYILKLSQLSTKDDDWTIVNSKEGGKTIAKSGVMGQAGFSSSGLTVTSFKTMKLEVDQTAKEAKLYIDSSLQDTLKLEGNTTPTGIVVNLGRRNNAIAFDNIKIYDTAE